MHGIVAYRSTFLTPNVCEKIHQFLSRTRKDAHKRKLVPCFLPHGVDRYRSVISFLRSTTAMRFDNKAAAAADVMTTTTTATAVKRKTKESQTLYPGY